MSVIYECNMWVKSQPSHPSRVRYVWCNRVALARSVHDMAKQMYDNRLYSTPAWAPLSSWLFECDEETAEKRGDVLVKFNRSNTEFHNVVAQCLWNLANGANTPWGRGATRPAFYAEIPIHEKVIGGGIKVTSIFFCRTNFRMLIYVSTRRAHL